MLWWRGGRRVRERSRRERRERRKRKRDVIVRGEVKGKGIGVEAGVATGVSTMIAKIMVIGGVVAIEASTTTDKDTVVAEDKVMRAPIGEEEMDDREIGDQATTTRTAGEIDDREMAEEETAMGRIAEMEEQEKSIEIAVETEEPETEEREVTIGIPVETVDRETEAQEMGQGIAMGIAAETELMQTVQAPTKAVGMAAGEVHRAGIRGLMRTLRFTNTRATEQPDNRTPGHQNTRATGLLYKCMALRVSVWKMLRSLWRQGVC